MYTVAEVAEYLKVSSATIYRLFESKKLNGRKVGGQIRFTKTDLAAYLGIGIDEVIVLGGNYAKSRGLQEA
ncbi:helix-turn-helix domain-containing protein [Clostridium thermarum]|uniref:helix-turn-helix domain-containing protein n=1 Tax=Clostridium thermarum TaxID=1716543 RepID=UPI00111DBA67|nr:helix-turn-helix domain-containing protein [Clostridium thermarum]